MPVKRENPSGPSNQKRTRFASPSPAATDEKTLEADNDLLEEDIQQGGQLAKRKARRKLQDQGGYGSDSSNDEEGVVPSRRAGAKEEEEEEDMDMFGDDVDTKGKEEEKGKGKEKEKEFMELNDFEGQEFGRVTGQRMDDEPDDADEDDLEAADRKRKAGLDGDMGFEMTGFNMKAEMDEGRFTTDGESYVVNDKDPLEKHDAWLEAVGEDEMLKARRAHREREKKELEMQEQEAGEGRKRDQERLLGEAVGLMERGETVLEALERLGREAEERRKKEEKERGKKMSWAEKQKERKAALAKEKEASTDDIHTANPFTNLSNIVSALTAIGNLDVYSLSRESIQRMVPPPKTQVAVGTNGSSASARDTRAFQYRFSMPYLTSLPEGQRPVEREVFGPFPVLQLTQWRNTGFFGGPACENVELRTISENGPGTWGSWSTVVGS